MTEFTKEELETINTALSIYEKRIHGSLSNTPFSKLLKKICDAIDKHSEHEIGKTVWAISHHEFEGSMSFELLKCAVERCELYQTERVVVHDTNIIDLEDYSIYESKNNAIDALIKHLEGFK
jgi:hypothetical protein